jgi:DNA-binding NtrC family response regulator
MGRKPWKTSKNRRSFSAWSATGGEKWPPAENLGISKDTLRRKIERYAISNPLANEPDLDD